MVVPVRVGEDAEAQALLTTLQVRQRESRERSEREQRE